MRHANAGKILGRTSSHRKAMYRNMFAALIEHERIRTTLPKAKELKRYSEHYITYARGDSASRRRMMFDRIRSRSAVSKLFNDIAPRYQNRPGGYLRILKCGFRPGDQSAMAIIEFVNELK